MKDITITAIVILFVLLIFIIPIITMTDRIDNASKLDVKNITSEFVNQIKISGKLTEDRYNKFLDDLTSEGNTYDISLEFKILDKNSENRTSEKSKEIIDEKVYYTVFTTQIEEELEKNGVYNLKEGDIVFVNVKNTNLTIVQNIKQFFYNLAGAELYSSQVSQFGLVTSTGTAIE